ncbi:MAG: putative rhamnosyl transferase [Rhodobacteraceae bacterium]|nr:putative rhamnosyl transferase [Paracoccaceae bacterium]
MQVIGLCRFSYLGTGGFQVEHDSLAERFDYLYAPERMEERFRTFETITLPPLRTQTDPDFTFLIVTSESMPKHYDERLMDLVADIPQVIVQKHKPGRHRAIMQRAINSVRVFDKLPCAQFRMDDDDAVACVYVEKLRQAVQDVRKLTRNHRHIAIDFNQGFIARPGPEGLQTAPTKTPYTTAALAVVLRHNVEQSVMNFAHMKVGQNMPTVTFSGDDMLVRGHNDFNDSRQKPNAKPVKLTPQNQKEEAHFKKVYNIDADHIRQVFSAA